MKRGYRQTEVGVIPDDWDLRVVARFGEVVTGSTPSTTDKTYWNGEFPWVTPTDISTRRDIFTSERCITSLGMKAVRPLPPSSVLVTFIASIGKNAVLKVAGACNQQINAIIPNANHDPTFLYYVFDSNKARLMGSAGITATSIISKGAFIKRRFGTCGGRSKRSVAA